MNTKEEHEELVCNDLNNNTLEKEQQIEEIARIICKSTSNEGNCGKCGFNKQCSKFKDATNLYNADYRKQSEGEWVRQKGSPEAICSNCGRDVVYQVIDNKWAFENFCPHCGAKMKAGTTQKYFSPEEVRKMTPKEVKENYDLIIQSMKCWK